MKEERQNPRTLTDLTRSEIIELANRMLPQDRKHWRVTEVYQPTDEAANVVPRILAFYDLGDRAEIYIEPFWCKFSKNAEIPNVGAMLTYLREINVVVPDFDYHAGPKQIIENRGASTGQ